MSVRASSISVRLKRIAWVWIDENQGAQISHCSPEAEQGVTSFLLPGICSRAPNLVLCSQNLLQTLQAIPATDGKSAHLAGAAEVYCWVWAGNISRLHRLVRTSPPKHLEHSERQSIPGLLIAKSCLHQASHSRQMKNDSGDPGAANVDPIRSRD